MRRGRRFVCFGCMSLLLGTVGCAGTDPIEGDFAIVGANVIPMTSDAVLEDYTIVIRDSEIVAIAPSRDVRISSETMTIDGTGRYVMPGMVESHVHLRAAKTMDLFLSYGFTTLRNMHGGLGDPLTWQREIRVGTRTGPSLINASPVLAWNTDAWTLPGWGPISTFDSLKLALSAIADSGYASVKVFQFPRDAFGVLMTEANRLGLPVTGHAPITDSGDPDIDLTLDEVLTSGMTVIEHMGDLIKFGLDPARHDSASADALAERVASSGIAVGTTTGATVLMAAALAATSDSAFVTPERYAQALKYGGQQAAEFLYRLPGLWRDNNFIYIDPEFLKLFVRLLDRKGVPIVVSTDAHNGMAVAGLAALEDLDFLVASGLSHYEALATVTSAPARVFGGEGRWGVVAIGARADLLLLSSNPLDDLGALTAIEGLSLRGDWLDRATLTELRTSAENATLLCGAPRCD